MSEQAQRSLEERSRGLFDDSVEGVDFATRSRLTRARMAALEAAASSRSWTRRLRFYAPAAGMTAAAALAAVLWVGSPFTHPTVTVADGQNLEDLDIVAAADGNADAMDMLQDEVEFYDWANRGDGAGSSAST